MLKVAKGLNSFQRTQGLGRTAYLHSSRSLSNQTTQNYKTTIEHDDNIEFEPIINGKRLSTETSTLKYAYRRDGETFGQLVNEVLHDRDPLHNSRVITPEEAQRGVDPRYRNEETGELLQGATSKDARLHPQTLAGRVNRRRIEIPDVLSKAINNNMLLIYDPRLLKSRASEFYISLNERDLHTKTETELEADVQIATTFIQNYASCFQVLDELRNRIGKDKFNPRKVLDFGYGPATGMLALNDLMGDEFNPDVKDVVVNGSFYMERRAKILLSRQVNEYYARPGEETDELQEAVEESQSEAAEEEEMVEDEYIGKVKTNSLHVKSIIMNKLRPAENKYDLIIAQHQLLTDDSFFPHQVDEKLDRLVKRLAPGGHLVLIERGNPLGGEIISRARQVMLRPENHENKASKIPRLYKRSIIDKKKKEVEKRLESMGFSAETYDVQEDLKNIEPELLEEFDIVDSKDSSSVSEASEDIINLKVVAPCSHHGRCPLQHFKPEYYRFGDIGKRLKFCSFSIDVGRPKFSMELKRGGKLATKWSSENSGIGIKGLATGGKGRPQGKDYETANYSYLTVERSAENPAELERLREAESEVREIGHMADSIDEYPRVLGPPLKKKGFVVADVCAPSGHLEKWHISKSVGRQEYHDARKLAMGDLWALGNKSVIQSTKENVFYFERLEAKEKALRTKAKRDSERMKRKIASDYKRALDSEPTNLEESITRMAQMDAYHFLAKPKQQELLKDKPKYKY